MCPKHVEHCIVDQLILYTSCFHVQFPDMQKQNTIFREYLLSWRRQRVLVHTFGISIIELA